VPFAYYERLSRAQQKIYRESDAVTEVRLERPAKLHPLVAGLEAALGTEERSATQAATERLVHGLTDALGISRVTVEVLAARPHAQWGELHGLYTVRAGGRPKIQLWMRTAKQKRVVAFRTFLRTMLHEVGHHVDYTLLRLADSFHTEGFYKRESSLFYQLVPTARKAMATVMSVEEWARVPVDERLARLERTPTDLARLVRGQTDATLSRRPAPEAWSAKEVVCHLRDAEEHLSGWIRTILASDDPELVETATADQWAEERQYARDHAGAAWQAFSQRRDETLDLVRNLDAAAWRRAGRHARRGPLTVDALVALIAWHDDNHLDQVARALDGRA
jgi:DinB family protein